MLPFVTSFLAILVAFVLPTIVGLFIVAGFARIVSHRYVAAFALGLYLWFFSDTIGDSGYLDVYAGFTGGVEQIALVLLFAAGLLFVFSIDRSAFGSQQWGSSPSLMVPLLLAFALGIHGFGEGTAFSATAATTPATDLLGAFGGLSAAIAFVLHKVLEPMMIGAAYWVYSGSRAKNLPSFLKDNLVLTLLFVFPGVLGSAMGYFFTFGTAFVFALALGASFYVPIRLGRPIFSDSNPSVWGSEKIALSLLLGFLSFYLAALFHS